jgi:hypothetical protein
MIFKPRKFFYIINLKRHQKGIKKLKKGRQISSGTILIRKISDLAKTTKFVNKELNA